eukprot:4792023-Prymnesium_polylepis.2
MSAGVAPGRPCPVDRDQSPVTRRSILVSKMRRRRDKSTTSGQLKISNLSSGGSIHAKTAN